jgi:hypothetical protein
MLLRLLYHHHTSVTSLVPAWALEKHLIRPKNAFHSFLIIISLNYSSTQALRRRAFLFLIGIYNFHFPPADAEGVEITGVSIIEDMVSRA